MKQILLLFSALFIATQLVAGGAGWNNNRIACSADGNNQPDPNTYGGWVPGYGEGDPAYYLMHANWQKGDPDDWGATPAALAMLAKLELQGKLVHYSYNNFIGAPKHTTQTNHMHNAVQGAIKHWNFDSSVFFDVPEDNQKAINHLAAEIGKSTASDPLYYLHMGPTELLYRALQKTKADGNGNAIQYMHIISHSQTYNDNNIRRKDHHRMDHVKKDFPTVKYHGISDQNNCNNKDAGWCSKPGGKYDWGPFQWMENHKDKSLQWLYDRLTIDKQSKADISDAGMLWYILKNDEKGNPSKFQTFIEPGILCDDCDDPCDFRKSDKGIEYGPDYIIFDATATGTQSIGNWVKVTPGSTAPYKHHSGATNDTYMVFNGNVYGSGPPNSPLKYTFTCPESATYRLTGRLHQHLEIIPDSEHEKDDKCNDVYVSMQGDFTTGGGYTTEQLKGTHFKFAGRAGTPTGWGGLFHGEVHEGGQKIEKGAPTYKLTKGKEYTIVLYGRSKGFAIDYFVLCKSGAYTVNGWKQTKVDPNNFNSPEIILGSCGDPIDPEDVIGCETILAKDFNNRSISGYDPADDDWRTSGGVVKHVLYCKGTSGLNQPSAAEIKYSGKPQGNAIFTVHAMQEPDGECTYEVFVNGKKVGEKKTTDVFESTHNDPDKQYAIEKLEIKTLAKIKTGDIIRVTSNQVTNGKVPEGDKTATARGRWHALEVCVRGSKINDVAFVDLPEEIVQSQSIPVTISYSALEELEVVAILSSPKGDWLGNAKQKVQTGSGTLDLTIALSEMPAIADGYNIKCDIRPVDGDYASFLKEDKATINIVGKAFHGNPVELPGIIEAEDYDNGGEGVAYHDIDPENKLEKYRTDGVDIEVCAEGGFNVGYVAAEEWLTYTVNVTETGTYSFTARTASNTGTGKFYFEIDGVKIGESLTAPSTNDWHVYTDVVLENIPLEKGEHVVKFVCENNGLNLDKITVILTEKQEPQFIQLKAGWNLIGCPINGGVPLKTVLADIWDKVEIVKDFDGFYDVGQEDYLNSLSEFKYGKGYFIKVTEDCELIWE